MNLLYLYVQIWHIYPMIVYIFMKVLIMMQIK